MAFPAPSIYTYRVVQVLSQRQSPEGYWLTEFSTDSGTTWLPLHSYTFQSYYDAEKAIGFVVSKESDLQKIVDGNQSFNNAPSFTSTLAPRRDNLAYPPT